MKIGDWVNYAVDGMHPGSGYVIGIPQYSGSYEHVVVLATARFHGMPINARWCEPTGQSDVGKAESLARRYNDLYPGFLKSTADQQKDV